MKINPKIFISYSWSDKKIVDKIDDGFKRRGITLHRDERELQNYQSIRQFMKGIRTADYVILCISDAFMKSRNCLFEIWELLKDDGYLDRTFPVIVDRKDFDLFSAKAFIDYIKYWGKQYESIEKEISGLKPEEVVELFGVLREIANIRNNIGSFILGLQERKIPLLDELTGHQYSDIIDAIDRHEAKGPHLFDPYVFRDACRNLTMGHNWMGDATRKALEVLHETGSPREVGNLLLTIMGNTSEGFQYYNRDEISCKRFVLFGEIIRAMGKMTSIAYEIKQKLIQSIKDDPFAYDWEYNDFQHNRLHSLIKALLVIGDSDCYLALLDCYKSPAGQNGKQDVCRRALQSVGYDIGEEDRWHTPYPPG